MNILIGPKLGDFFHCLLIPKLMWEYEKQKCNIFLCEKYDSFTNGLKKTYEELKDIVLYQEYVKEFKIHEKEKIDMDLCNFRNSSKLCRDSWTNILIDMFLKNKKTIFDLKIIDWKKDYNYKDTFVFNRSSIRIIERGNKVIENFLKNKKCLFIYSFNEIDNFLFKKNMISLKCGSLNQMLTIINSCKMFIGNLSAPLAIAHSLNKDRLCEIATNDGLQYTKEILNYNKISWFSQNNAYITENHYDSLKNIL